MKYFKKVLALTLTMLLAVTGCVQPVMAEEVEKYDTETGYPLLDMVRDRLNADEILNIQDVSISEGEAFYLIDPEWLETNDDKPAPFDIVLYKVIGQNGEGFDNAISGDYTAYYVVTPSSGNPAYELSRVITVMTTEEPTEGEIPVDEADAPQYEDDPPAEDLIIGDMTTDEDESIAEDMPVAGEMNEQADMEDDNEKSYETDAEEDLFDADGETESTVEGESLSAGSEDAGEEVSSESENHDVEILPESEPDTWPADLAESESDMLIADPVESDPDTSLTDPTESSLESGTDLDDTTMYENEESELTDTEDVGENDELSDESTTTEANVIDSEEGSEEDGEVPEEDDYEEEEVDPDNIVISGPAKVTRGSKITYPQNLGSYSTFQYYVDGKQAYCLEADRSSPKGGSFAQEILDSNPNLVKSLYYGYGGPGDITGSYFSGESTDIRTIMTHIAASYFYTGSYSRATKGCSSSGLNRYGVESWLNYLAELPDPPSPGISLSKKALEVIDTSNGVQTTEATTLNADYRNSITVALPDNVTYHNRDNGEMQTGGSVQISGGTTFYFTAPLSVSGTWKTGDMSGSIGIIWKVLVIQTGSKTQNLGSYASESYGGTVHFSVEWKSQVKLSLIKADAENTDVHLSSATFGVYSDAVCTNQLETMTTDESGFASCMITRAAETVYVKELTAPIGYRLNRTVYSVNLGTNDTITIMIKDEKQRAGLKITKKGEVLTDAQVTSDGVDFVYQVRRLSGAVYRVTADSNIYNADGSLMYQKGELIAENLTTNSEGEVILNDLPLGQYLIEETKAPAGFLLASEKQVVSLEYAGQEVEVAFGETTFVNERQKADVRIQKADDQTAQPLPNAQFSLFAASDIQNDSGETVVKAGTLIETKATDNEGNIAFTADLPIGFNYCIREIKAPAGYILSSDIYTFSFNASVQTVPAVEFTHSFTDTAIRVEIQMKKIDHETEHAQGDAGFAGAVYGLYARNDIIAPDGKTGTLYKKDALISTITTDGNGEASITGLYPGCYYLKEITPSIGYLLDTMEYDVNCTNVNGDKALVTFHCTVEEQVAKQPFQIIKVANNGKTNADLLEGAGFSAWLVSSLAKNTDGSYDFNSASPVVIASDGATEIFTDRTGHAVTIPLPYGTYIVKETTTPDNFSPVDDFTVTVSENLPNTPQVWRVLLDEEFAAKLKIVKVDETTGRTILLSSAEFSIYDLDNEAYVSQVTSYPQPTTHTTFKTDASGTLTLPETLLPGHYRITEIAAPEGYLLNTESVDVTISAESLYRIDSLTGEPVIEVKMHDRAVLGRIAVQKEGEMLTGYENGKFIYANRRLAGVTFDVYAAEDIYTADHQKDENGSRYLEYAGGTLVATLTTDANGEACTDFLPLGTYSVVEKQTVEGYVLDTQAYTVTLSYLDAENPVVISTVSAVNQRQRFSISVEKQNSDGSVKLSGAEFALYAGADIYTDSRLLVSAGTCLAIAETDETGALVFDIDLPMGKYLINETKAPEGFVLSEEVQEIHAEYHGQDTAYFGLTAVFRDEPTRVAISKADATTGVELDGASLTLTDTDGNVIDSWTSVAGEPHIIEGLTIGATYMLREDIAPYGYLITDSVKFVVGDSAEIQRVVMKDEVPTGTLIITKTGEFLSDVSVLNTSTGWISNAFSYITGNMKDVTFGVYAYEDIRHADGATENYYSAGDQVGTITTDNTGIAKLEGLPLGRYYVKEIETQNGYVLDSEVRMIDLTYRDSQTKVVTYSEAWQNERQKASVKVLKQDKETSTALEGAVFGLFAAESITSNGTVIMGKDAMIEQRATDSKGRLTFEADLPVGFNYYVVELVPPAGYAYDPEDIRSFAFEGGDAETVFEYTFSDEITQMSFSKNSIATGEELEGAHLQVSDTDGNIIDEWISEKEPHHISELTVDKTYILTETLSAPGYTTAESISFTVGNTGELQQVVMKDDITKVQISKTDLGGNELEGAKLTVLDSEGNVIESWISGAEPHYIEMLPIGSYTLREETAPNGYTVAEDINFEVLDTNEIQKVTMKDAPIDNPGTPKTGDDRNPVIWAIAGVTGIAGIVCALLILRKRRH